MADTGAEHSAVTQPVAPLSQKQATIVGAVGNRFRRPLLLPRRCNLGGREVIHESYTSLT